MHEAFVYGDTPHRQRFSRIVYLIIAAFTNTDIIAFIERNEREEFKAGPIKGCVSRV
jgi:hypothetical protein